MIIKQQKKVQPFCENYRQRRNTNSDDRVGAEAAVGIMKHKDGTIEKRKF